MLPYFSKKEAKRVCNNFLKIDNCGRYQAKTVKSISKKDHFACSFLDEKSHKCKIYNKRPFDCSLWPFMVGWDKNKKDVFLWIADSSFCPAVTADVINKANGMADGLVSSLKKEGFFDEIKNDERILWPYEKYEIKIQKLTDLLNKDHE